MNRLLSLLLIGSAAALWSATAASAPFDSGFSLGVSYYGGTCATDSNLRSDFVRLASLGFRGPIRIWINWNWDHFFGSQNCSVFTSSGGLRPEMVTKVHFILELAESFGQSVDFTVYAMKGDTGNKPFSSYSVYLNSLRAFVAEFKSHSNWFMDISNETNLDQLSPRQIAEVFATLRGIDPSRKLTISIDDSAKAIGEFYVNLLRAGARPDVLAPHFPRDSHWAADVGARIGQMNAVIGAAGFTPPPTYVQEENRNKPESNRFLPTDQFINSARNSKAAGAISWVFHTQAMFYPWKGSFFDQLDNTERDVVTKLAAALGIEGGGQLPPPVPGSNSVFIKDDLNGSTTASSRSGGGLSQEGFLVSKEGDSLMYELGKKVSNFCAQWDVKGVDENTLKNIEDKNHILAMTENQVFTWKECNVGVRIFGAGGISGFMGLKVSCKDDDTETAEEKSAASLAWNPAQIYRMKLVNDGGNFSLYRDDQLIINADATFFPSRGRPLQLSKVWLPKSPQGVPGSVDHYGPIKGTTYSHFLFSDDPTCPQTPVVPKDDLRACEENGAAVNASAASLLSSLYTGVLDRTPDVPGACGYYRSIRDRGLTGLVDSAIKIGSSNEFAKKFTQTNEDAVKVLNNLYRSLLNRKRNSAGNYFDPVGGDIFLPVLRGEVESKASWTVIRTILRSSEFKSVMNVELSKLPTTYAEKFVACTGDEEPDETVSRWMYSNYSAVLGRTPDSPGSCEWYGALAESGQAGVASMAIGMMESQEFKTRFVLPDNATLVLNNFYRTYLQRSKRSDGNYFDPTGAAEYLPWLRGEVQDRSPASVIDVILRSGEFQRVNKDWIME